MTQLPPDILAFQNRFGKWDWHINHIRQSDSFTEEERERILDGLNKLRLVFDDKWLRKVSVKWFAHPLTGYINNYAPWSYFWLAEFGEKLAVLESLSNFDKLKAMLKSIEKYRGAEAEVLVASRLVKTGLTVEFYPKVNQRVPDVRARVDNQDYYFEVTTLGTSAEESKATDTFHELVFPSYHEVMISCKVHRPLSKPHIQELQEKIHAAVLEVKRTEEHVYISEPRVLDWLAVPRSKEAEFRSLLKRYGMEEGLHGPPFNSDSTWRLGRRFVSENRQLPEDKPGVIVVSGGLFSFGSLKEFCDNMVYQIEEDIYAQENLIFGVIIDRMGGIGLTNEVYEQPHYYLSRTTLSNLHHETVVVIKNRYSKFPVNEKILRAFIR